MNPVDPWRCCACGDRSTSTPGIHGPGSPTAFAGHRRPGGWLPGGAVLFIDLDRFTEVNDRGGHALGDQLLIRIARRLREQIAEVTPDAVVGRLGGDEFAAVLPGLDREAAAGPGGRLVHALVDEVVAGRRTDGAGLQQHRAGDGQAGLDLRRGPPRR
jgi:GGDEF domain-containing protein